jgi:sigma-B regulation protein RsbU (phosphoserine phosphatase)
MQALVLSSRLAYHFKKTESLGISLKSSNEELTALKENLEDKVEERTFELNHALNLLKNDLSIAQKIQSKIIPDPKIQFPELEIQFLYQPMDAVGGDIFDISEINPGIYRIFLADALGHGVQAALLTMAIKSEYESVKNVNSIKTCIMELSYNFRSKFHNLNTYFSAILCDLNMNLNSLEFVSAGHPNQILQFGNKIENLTQTAHIIGLDRNFEVGILKFEWKPGNRLFLFSDGLFEHFNKHMEMFGEDRIQTRIQNSSREGLKKTIHAIENDILNFLGQNKIMDDLTLIAIERK